MHHQRKDCDQLITKVQYVIESAAKSGQLFPKKLKLTRTFDEEEISDTQPLRPNGGWADLRDLLLCLNMTIAVR